MTTNTTSSARTPFLFEELEPRVLFSADFAPGLIDIAPDEEKPEDEMAIGADLTDDQSGDDASATALGAESEDAVVRHEIVFVDANTPDAEQLVNDLLQSSDESRQMEVVYLDSERDGIEQITEALAGQQDLDAVHIISHGSDSGVQLGNTWLAADTLQTYTQAIESWSGALDDQADLLIYGCELAAGADGRALLGALGGLTGADVAASDDLTGSALLGGDWELEYRAGDIEAMLAISSEFQQSYSSVLVVTHTSYENAPSETEVKSDQNWGQTFSYTSGGGTYDANRIEVQLRRDADASAQNITLALRESWDGPDLGSATIASSDLDTAMAWESFDFPGVTLNDGQTYYIRVSSDTLDGKVYLGFDPSATYADGALIDDSGSPVASEDLAFRVQEVPPATGEALWVTTADDVASPSGAPGLDSWTDGEVLEFGGPSLTFEPGTTAGTFSSVFDVDSFGVSTNLRGLHYVTQSITVGSANSIDLQAGDVLFITANDVTLTSTNSLDVKKRDVVLFRPDTQGDYSAGTFTLLLDEPIVGKEIQAVTLVEQTTTVGDATLDAGTFLLVEAGKNDVMYFTADDVGATTTTGSLNTLLSGNDLGIDQPIAGLELIENTVTAGGRTLPAGTVLASLVKPDAALANNNLSVTEFDIFALDVTQTTLVSGTTDASASLFFEGADVGIDDKKEAIDGFTLAPTNNAAPTATNLSAAETYTVDTPLDLVDIVVSDVDSANVTATLTLSDAAAGSLSTGTSGSVTSTFAGGVWTASGAIADVNALLAGVTFTPAAGYSLDFTIATSVDDGVNVAVTGTKPMTAVSGNSAPVLGGANDLTDIYEDPVSNPGTLVSDLISGQVSDADAGALQGIAVIGVDDTNGTWEYSTDGGSSWSAFGAVDMFNARLLAADASTYVRFVPDVDWNGTVSNGLTFYAWDQTSGSAGGSADLTRTLNVRDEFSTASYSDNYGSAAWAGPWVETTDDGAPGSGEIQITGGELRFHNENAASVESIERSADLSAAVSATLTFDFRTDTGVNSSDSVLVEISDDGGATWTTLETITGISGAFSDTRSYDISAYATASTQIRFTVQDFVAANDFFYVDNLQVQYLTYNIGGSSAFSTASASSAITVIPNQEPTGADNTVTLNEDTAYTFAAADFGFADVDAGDFLTAVRIDSLSLPAGSTLQLSGVDVTAGQVILAADIPNLVFTPAANANGSGYASFTFSVRDQAGAYDTVPNTMTLDVTAVNDAPTATNLSAPETYIEDTPLDLTDIVVSDVDGGNVTVTLTLSDAAAGTLSTATSGSVTSTFAGGVWTASGAIADVNALLAGVTFNPALNYNSSFTIATSVDDGVAAPITGTKVITGNAAPTTVGITDVTVNEDAPATAVDLFAAFDDNEDPDSALTYTLTGNTNTVLFSSTPIDGATGTLALNYAANANGTADITVRATDTVGSFVESTFTITVNPVNDAPTVGTNSGLSLFEGGTSPITSSEIQVIDVDNAANQISYTLTTIPTGGTLFLNGAALSAGDSFTQADINSNRVTYAHGGGLASSDGFSFTVDDGAGGTLGPITFSVNVKAVSLGPTGIVGEPIDPPSPPPAPSDPPTADPAPSGTTGSTGGGGSASTGTSDESGSDGAGKPGVSDFVPLDFSESDQGYAQYREGSTHKLPGSEASETTEDDAMVESVEGALAGSAETVDNRSETNSLWTSLDKMETEMRKAAELEKLHREIILNVSKGIGLSLTVGYISWLLSSGALLASALSSMPLWTKFDPLPILAGRKKRRKGEEADDAGEHEKPDEENNIESLFDDKKSKRGRRGRVQ